VEIKNQCKAAKELGNKQYKQTFLVSNYIDNFAQYKKPTEKR
jgi:hypothetical protein